MQLLNKDMFTTCKDGDALCVTTNGIVKWDGSLTMGAGVAKVFKDNFKGIHKLLGKMVSESGNQVHYLGQAIIDEKTVHLFSFPTKHHWQDESNVDLIEQSCIQLNRLVEEFDLSGDIYIPLPGCGHGRLDWDTQVEPIVKKHLPENNFKICYGAFGSPRLTNAEFLPTITQVFPR